MLSIMRDALLARPAKLRQGHSTLSLYVSSIANLSSQSLYLYPSPRRTALYRCISFARLWVGGGGGVAKMAHRGWRMRMDDGTLLSSVAGFRFYPFGMKACLFIVPLDF